jgi:dTDP-4-dehydrorhamnose 3,5-epimerase-like enzyme
MNQVTLCELQNIPDPARGTLCVTECQKHIPFEIRRIFHMHGVPTGTIRGRHAHRTQSQFLICLSGRVEVTTIHAGREENFVLAKSSQGIYFPALTWISVKVAEPGTIYMVMCSEWYNEDDYIRNFTEFQALTATP